MKGLLEILTEKRWMISPDFVHGIRSALEQNLNGHLAFSRPARTCGFVSLKDADGNSFCPENFQISEDGAFVKGINELNNPEEQTFPFVSVLTVDGPITRNGGGCSYGSFDHRNMMMAAASHPLCRGHLFVINTPGGSAWAKNDYQQAIDYAHSKGQPVVAFIDGTCASAGMYLASLCDEVYYMHPKDEVGCIGVMAAFYTEANGDKNAYTNETYHELYDPESFDKNKAYRDMANDGKDEELVSELAALGKEFRADVKKHRPNVTDEHLHGKVFDAKDVEGILVDGQSTFFESVKRVFALYDKSAEPIQREEPAKEPEGNQSTNTNTINMENYPKINAACGLKDGEIEMKEEGAFMNAPLLDSLEAHLTDSEQQMADAQQKATDTQAALAELQSQFDAISEKLAASEEAKAVAEKALADAQEEHQQQLDALETAHTAAIAQKDEEIASLVSAKENAEKALDTAKAEIATAEQTIADKDAQIAELSNEPSNEPEGGSAPANNGEGVKTQTLREFDPSHYKTNAERKAAFERFKNGEQ